MGIDQSIGGAVIAGMFSFLSPCVLPLVPAYLCFLAGTDLRDMQSGHGKDAGRARVFLRALFFVLGFSTVFVILGATASTIGQWLTIYFDKLAIVAGALLIVMGLHFLGVFRIGLLFREARFQTSARPAGPLGAYVVGLAFAFGWTPCVGPVLAAILMLAGAQDTASHGVVLLGAYSIGIGAPFLAASLFIGPFMRFLKRFSRHLGLVEKIMGAALVVTGLLFMTGAMPVIGNWMLQTFPSFGEIG